MTSPKRSPWRRVERAILGAAFAVVVFLIERRVLGAIRRKGTTAPSVVTPEVTRR